jgi:hypothetical protein
MNIETKSLVKNKEWLLTNNKNKIGSIIREQNKFFFLKRGKKIEINNISDFEKNIGIEFNKTHPVVKINSNKESYKIYDYPCKTKPFEPVFNLKKKLPLFLKRNKSQSYYCAGYYLIKLKKGWVKNFCPKLITIDRNSFHGPFKTEEELKIKLVELLKNEKLEHNTN